MDDEKYMYPFDMGWDLSPYYDGEEKENRKYSNVHDNTVNNSVYRKARKRVISGQTGKCDRCPWHGGENRGMSRRPKDDRHKGYRRERRFKNRINWIMDEHYRKSVLRNLEREIGV